MEASKAGDWIDDVSSLGNTTQLGETEMYPYYLAALTFCSYLRSFYLLFYIVHGGVQPDAQSGAILTPIVQCKALPLWSKAYCSYSYNLCAREYCRLHEERI